ncbi:unnamed protein product [Clonostachys chloroleuca]|uniref:Aprataxin-like protein n=1 Tax=Clonostachys chloroleuca TaxID=1926264 RepID=A0AA35VNJ5_9HYPO|nr:unnamed protein product [Clonostachys chloroleuca]
MGSPGSDSDEAITKDEIQGVEPPQTKGSRSKNAFTELMRPKPKATPTQGHSHSSFSRGGHPFKDRMGLGAYLADPSSFPSSRVIYHTPDFVVINDLFPKSTIHTLLLPRSPKHNLMHPFDALEDADFRAKVVAETGKLKALVASELRRRLGHNSRADAARQAVLDGDDDQVAPDVELDPADGLPRGRDWSREVIVGVHAKPSMSHLHVHVLSRDMHSPKVKHRKHYNSFNTPFLVDVADFPLALDDPRRQTKEAGYLHRDLRCWRCGRNFGNRFKQLKDHLEEEFEEWSRE